MGDGPLRGALASVPLGAGLQGARLPDAHWGQQTEPGLHTAFFVVSSGASCPPVLSEQAAVVPGHLHRGNALVPGSLLGERLGARVTAWQGADSVSGGSEGWKEGRAPFPLQSEEVGSF